MVERPLNVLLIDPDPILRLGLEAALAQRAEVRAIAAVETLTQAAQCLEQQRLAGMLPPDVGLVNLTAMVDRQGPGLGQSSPGQLDPERLELEQLAAAIAQFQAQHPKLPLLGLEYQHPASLSLWSQRQGLAGYWARNQSLEELIQVLLRLRRGQQIWTLGDRLAPSFPAPSSPAPLPQNSGTAPLHRPQPQFAELQPTRLSKLGPWSGTVASGLIQVNQRLAQLDRQRSRASWVDRIWLDGARRELRTTGWLLGRFSGRALAAVGDRSAPAWELEMTSSVPLTTPLANPLANPVGASLDPGRAQPSASPNLSANPAPNPAPNPASDPNKIIGGSPSLAAYPQANGPQLQAMLFEQIIQRLPPGLVNLTGEPQEIDILNAAKRQELLSTVLRCWGDLLTDLRLSNLELAQLGDRQPALLSDWWATALGDFLGKYSHLQLADGPVELMPFLLQEQPNVEAAIFRHIPGVEILFSTLLFGTPVALDGVDYRPESPEAMARLGLLAENLLIQMANAIVQPLLNNFADVDGIKQSFYDKRLLSTREIEKFRNNLSWKYRVASRFQEAQDIYESRYGLLRFSEPPEAGGICGITKAAVYAPRRQEMAQLNTFQQVVTLALEVRDAVAPRLEVLTKWAGSAVVYLLTQIVGRGIGLVGRGVVQGVGNSVQDLRKMGKGDR